MNLQDFVHSCTSPLPARCLRALSSALLLAALPAAFPTVSHAAALPHGALVTGQEADGRPIYLCLVTTNHGTFPGKTWNDNAVCSYPDGEDEVSSDQYEIPATNGPIAWVAKNALAGAGKVMVGIATSGEPYYLCRALYEGGMHGGEMKSVGQGCKISYGGSTHVVRGPFEVATSDAPQPLTHLSPTLSRALVQVRR